MGSPAKLIRLMVGLVMPKCKRNISDESAVEQWQENSCYQYFCVETKFVTTTTCELSKLVHFGDRIEETDMQLFFKKV